MGTVSPAIVSARCDSTTEHTCIQTGQCIPISYVDDGYNDCGDNSEEGDYFFCPRVDSFKCTQIGDLDDDKGVCFPPGWVNDGVPDCPDGSDELKRRIGARCFTESKGEFEPLCTDPVDGVGVGAECDVNNRTGQYRTCQCIAGWKPTTKKNKCQLRELGDACNNNEDCISSTFATCSNNVCACTAGYKAHSDNLQCNVIKLNDVCSTTSDCKHVPKSSCTLGRCKCNSGLVANPNLVSCDAVTTKRPVQSSTTQSTKTSTSADTRDQNLSSTQSTNASTVTVTSTTESPPERNDIIGFNTNTLVAIVVATFLAAIFLSLLVFAILLMMICPANKETEPTVDKKPPIGYINFEDLEARLASNKALAPITGVHYGAEKNPENWSLFEQNGSIDSARTFDGENAAMLAASAPVLTVFMLNGVEMCERTTQVKYYEILEETMTPDESLTTITEGDESLYMDEYDRLALLGHPARWGLSPIAMAGANVNGTTCTKGKGKKLKKKAKKGKSKKKKK